MAEYYLTVVANPELNIGMIVDGIRVGNTPLTLFLPERSHWATPGSMAPGYSLVSWWENGTRIGVGDQVFIWLDRDKTLTALLVGIEMPTIPETEMPTIPETATLVAITAAALLFLLLICR